MKLIADSIFKFIACAVLVLVGYLLIWLEQSIQHKALPQISSPHQDKAQAKPELQKMEINWGEGVDVQYGEKSPESLKKN